MERQLGSKSSCLSVWEWTPGGGGGWELVPFKGKKAQLLEDGQWWEDTKSLSCCHTEKPLFTTVKKALSGVEVPKVETRSTWPGFTFWAIKNGDSGAATQTYWVRISGGGIRESAFLISAQVILMFPEVQPPLHQRQRWLEAARLTLLQMGPALLGLKGSDSLTWADYSDLFNMPGVA